MGHDTIPPPASQDVTDAHRLIKLVREGGDEEQLRAEAVIAQLHAEVRWLHSIIQKRAHT